MIGRLATALAILAALTFALGTTTSNFSDSVAGTTALDSDTDFRPANVTAPVLVDPGVLGVGVSLGIDQVSTWDYGRDATGIVTTGTLPITVTRVWESCVVNVCTPIPGATGLNLSITVGLLGLSIRVCETGVNTLTTSVGSVCSNKVS